MLIGYCVIVQISKNYISFWYKQQGSNLEPLIRKEGNVLPLYFYVNGNDFSVGQFAKERFLNGDTLHAFADYFNIITNPSKFFTIFGNQKHVKFLLYFAVEQHLSHFLNTVLYRNESIEEYRSQFPLRFIFSSDIVQKERLLVESIFAESGYDNVESLTYHQYLLNALWEQRIVSTELPVLLLTGIDGNLYIELFLSGSCEIVVQESIEDQGADPRLNIMAKMLFENAVSNTHTTLNEKDELSHLLPYAHEFLNQQSAIPRGDVVLSDGTTFYVQLRKKDLNERLVYYPGIDNTYRTIDSILNKSGIHENEIQVVLNGDDVNTSYFIERFRRKYSKVEGVASSFNAEVLKLAFKFVEDKKHMPCSENTKKLRTGDDPDFKKTPSDNTKQIAWPISVDKEKKRVPLPPPPPPPKTKISSVPLPPPPRPATIGSQSQPGSPTQQQSNVKRTLPLPPPPPPSNGGNRTNDRKSPALPPPPPPPPPRK